MRRKAKLIIAAVLSICIIGGIAFHAGTVYSAREALKMGYINKVYIEDPDGGVVDNAYCYEVYDPNTTIIYFAHVEAVPIYNSTTKKTTYKNTVIFDMPAYWKDGGLSSWKVKKSE